MRMFLMIGIAFSLASIAIARTTVAPTKGNKPSSNPVETSAGEKSEGKVKNTSEQVMDALEQGNPVANTFVEGDLNIQDLSAEDLRFTDTIFDGDVHISGNYNRIMFEHCQFSQGVDFYLLSTRILWIQDCKFPGAVWFNIDVVSFT